LPLLFGGVRLSDVIVGLAMIMLTALMLGSIGIWGSARARSSRGAVANAYMWSFIIAFITFALMGAELLFVNNQSGNPFPPRGREIVSILPNPYVGMVSAVVAPLGSDGLQGTPFDVVEVLLMERQGFDAGFFGVGPGPDPIDGAIVDSSGGPAVDRTLPLRRPPVWMYTVAIYLVVTSLALWGATRRVRAPATRIRSLRSRSGGS
jgi:hypothetical protein